MDFVVRLFHHLLFLKPKINCWTFKPIWTKNRGIRKWTFEHLQLTNNLPSDDEDLVIRSKAPEQLPNALWGDSVLSNVVSTVKNELSISTLIWFSVTKSMTLMTWWYYLLLGGLPLLNLNVWVDTDTGSNPWSNRSKCPVIRAESGTEGYLKCFNYVWTMFWTPSCPWRGCLSR